MAGHAEEPRFIGATKYLSSHAVGGVGVVKEQTGHESTPRSVILANGRLPRWPSSVTLSRYFGGMTSVYLPWQKTSASASVTSISSTSPTKMVWSPASMVS